MIFFDQVFQQLQQHFGALLLTVLAHFVLGFRPILLLQIFSTPYHFAENRLFRKFVLGLKPGYRIWGERFEGEVEQSMIKKELEGERKRAVAGAPAEQEVVVTGGGEGGGEGAVVLPAGAGEVSAAPEVSARAGLWGQGRRCEERVLRWKRMVFEKSIERKTCALERVR